MKNRVAMLILTTIFLAAGCGNEDTHVKNTEKTNQEMKEEQNVSPNEDILENEDILKKFEDYMSSIKEESDTIKTSLKNASTQIDMNMNASELYKLWDEALNYLWGELKVSLPEEEFGKLKDEQNTWIRQKEQAMEDAGKEFTGGSMYPLVVNEKGASLTEERVYELYDVLKEVKK